jgi:DNA-binding response OmpR family regulator
MRVLLAVVDPAARTLWEAILADHRHETVVTTPDTHGWDAVQANMPELAVIELPPHRPEALELCHRLRRPEYEPRPSFVVLVHADRAADMTAALECGADDILVGQPDRRTAVSHLMALERRQMQAAIEDTAATHHLLGLELAAPVADLAVRVRAATPASGAASTAQQTILLIDDEAQVRAPLRLALQRQGFCVLEASDGDEGLELIARRGSEIALVVVDQRMPRISGAEVLREIRQRPGHLPVVLMSGEMTLVAAPDADRPDAFLLKPFQLVDLARAVQRLLDPEVAASA